jgi:hypothetical protein
MFEPFDIVKDKNQPVARRQVLDRALEGDAINRAREGEVAGPNIPAWTVFLGRFEGLFQRNLG